MVSEASPSEVKEKKAVPFVPYLKLPSSPGEEAYLVGSKCKSCGQIHLGYRLACPNCSAVGEFEEVKLSREGELFVFCIVHQSAPGIPVPYIGAVIDLPEGLGIPACLTGIEPDPAKIKFGMKVKMVTEKVREDQEGNDIIAYKFKPVES